MSSLGELIEYSALLVELYYYKSLSPKLLKEAVSHTAFTIKYSTKYCTIGSLDRAWLP